MKFKIIILIVSFFIGSSSLNSLASTFTSYEKDLYLVGSDGKIYTRTLQSDWSEYYILPNDLKAVAITIGIIKDDAPYDGFNTGEKVDYPFLEVITADGVFVNINLSTKEYNRSRATLPRNVSPLATGAAQ